MTSGGTESILMAVKAPGTGPGPRPEIQCRDGGSLYHSPAFNKAADYLGLKIIQTPVMETSRRCESHEGAITANTILLAATAVTYPHGMIDPIAEIGALAERETLVPRGWLFWGDTCCLSWRSWAMKFLPLTSDSASVPCP